MAQAQSIRDLLKIRHANRAALESINGSLGTALGIKHSKDPNSRAAGHPSVIVFVPRKINEKWLPPGQTVPKNLSGPDGLSCPVDVVEGGKAEDIIFRTVNSATGADEFQSWMSLRHTPQLSQKNMELREALRGWRDVVGPGAQLGGVNPANGSGYVGTLGCVVRDRVTGDLGILTNHHVPQSPGHVLHFPDPLSVPFCETVRSEEFLDDEDRFPGDIDEHQARFRVDCAFAKLSPNINRSDVDPRLPVLSEDGERIEHRRIGEPLALDLDTMGPLGRRVIGVGRTRSFQRGTIVAFAYEHQDAPSDARYTDYLIIGDEPDEFSDPGDSGKLILTDEEEPKPVALLWGGWWEKLRSGKDQENWTYAIDINIVLDLLNIDIVSDMTVTV